MPLDPVAQSSQSDGRWKIAYVPSTATNPLSVATLKGGTTFNPVYSFTPDGFNWTTTQAEVSDPRLTLVQSLSRPGKVSETLELKFVASKDAGSAAVLLTGGLTGSFVVRRGVDNATDWTVGQTVDVLSFVLGVQRPDAPTENGIDTISMTAFITAPTQRSVTLVA